MLNEFQIDQIKFRSLRLCRRPPLVPAPLHPQAARTGAQLPTCLAILAHLGALDRLDGHLGSHLAARSAATWLQHEPRQANFEPTSFKMASERPPRPPKIPPDLNFSPNPNQYFIIIWQIFNHFITNSQRSKQPNNQQN